MTDYPAYTVHSRSTHRESVYMWNGASAGSMVAGQMDSKQ